jgi:hypothetical protein
MFTRVAMILVSTVMLVGGLTSGAVAHAEILDEQQLIGAVPQHFGHDRKLGQTFTRDVPAPIARVQVKIRRNFPAVGPLTLNVLRGDFTPLDSATIPVAALPPVGVDVWQTFDFGCNGGPLVGSAFYGLVLESPGSVMPNAYTWYGDGADPYPGGAPTRQGWLHNGPGWTPMLPLGGGAFDFTFRVVMC